MPLTASDIATLEALKKKKKNKQAMAAGAASAVLRGDNEQRFKCSRIISESARPISAIESRPLPDSPSVFEGPKVEVILITEGLGNRRDMHYYGPECIDSGPQAFEGVHCFLNHPSYTEERDIPERRVQDMCGYFKNVKVTVIEGVRSVVGELHFDLSETGKMGFDKMLTALHYQTEFPGSDREYVGLSVNAGGESEPREINLNGETVSVDYVTRFTEATSCDIVTLPARGGKFLALVESAAGASMKTKEVRNMIVKELQAAQSALKEALSIKDPEQKAKKTLEAQTKIEGILKDVLESQSRKNKESDASETKESDVEESKESDTEESKEADDTSAGPKKKGKKAKPADDDADDAKESKEEACESDDAMEANRLAVKHMIQESRLDPELFDVKELSRKGLSEAKKEIARVKRLSESMGKKMLAIVSEVSPSHAAKISESGKSGKGVSNDDLFAGCSL